MQDRQSWWAPDFRIGVEHSLDEYTDAALLPHRHAETAFVFCLDGHADFTCGGRSYSLEAGEMLVHNAGEIHQSYYGDGSRGLDVISLVVDRGILGDVLHRLKRPEAASPERVLFIGKASDRRLVGMARELVDELETARPGLDLAVQALVTLILVHVLRYSIEPTLLSRAPLLAPQLPTWQLNRALRYLSSHDKSSFSLPELCADIGSSPSRFIPLFKNSTGLTPYAYFNKLILYRAAAQFQQPNRSVKEVSYELGFRNASHFCRFVRQIAGHTPTSLPRQSADDGVFNPLKLPWQHFADHL